MIHLCFSRTASASIPAISRFTRQILANAKTHPKPRPLITGLLRSLEQCSFSKRIRCGKKQHSYILDRMIRFQPFVHSNRWKNHAPRQCNRLAGKIRLTSKSTKNSRFQTENGCFMVAGAGFEPHDLRVMSPTSYQTALPRDMKFASLSQFLFIIHHPI